jgi:hypothetical protein
MRLPTLDPKLGVSDDGGGGVLLAGDMLSDVLIPLLDARRPDQVGAYETALDRVGEAATHVDVLIPGHGAVAEGPEVAARVAADRATSTRCGEERIRSTRVWRRIGSPAPTSRTWNRPEGGGAPGHDRADSKDGTHDEHPPARNEMCQVVRQALDVFARLLLEALHFEDVGDQHVIGLTDGLSGDVRRPRSRQSEIVSSEPRTMSRSSAIRRSKFSASSGERS